MAGKYHHHVWQMLQRGFSWKENNDNQIWVYRRGKEPEQTVTRLFGGQKYFYGPKGSVADTNITRFEGSVQSFVQDVRKLSNGTKLDASIVSPIISHLEMRSLFFRDEMSRLADRVVLAVGDTFKSKGKLKRLFAGFLEENPDRLNEFLRKNNIPKDLWPSALELMKLELPRLIDGAVIDIIPNIEEKFCVLQNLISESVMQAHIEALEADFTRLQTH